MCASSCAPIPPVSGPEKSWHETYPPANQHSPTLGRRMLHAPVCPLSVLGWAERRYSGSPRSQCRDQPSIDRHVGSGDVAGAVTEQELHEVADLRGMGEPSGEAVGGG